MKYVVTIILGAFIVSWALQQRLAFALVFLPYFTGRPDAPDYAVFSSLHFLDIVNLLVLLFPSLGALALLPRSKNLGAIQIAMRQYLILLSLGSVLFLFLIDPVFGMAVDWDLMSITLFPLCLLVLQSINTAAIRAWAKITLLCAVIGVTTSGLFLATLTIPSAAEARFKEHLDLYGQKNRSGWTILTDYFETKGDTTKADETKKAFLIQFPDDSRLWKARAEYSKGKYESAASLSDMLIGANPLRSDFQQMAAEAYGKLRDFRRSMIHYQQAITLRPYDARLRSDYALILVDAGLIDSALVVFASARELDLSNTTILEGIALAHIRSGNLPLALACADTILLSKSHDAGGILIQMVVALNQQDAVTARLLFGEFLQYGKNRSDYTSIIDYYDYLLRVDSTN